MEREIGLEAAMHGIEINTPTEDLEPVKLKPDQEQAVEKRLNEIREKMQRGEKHEWPTKN